MGVIDLQVRIGNAVLPNPVGVASGTFGYGGEYEQLIDLARLGALYTKAITLEPRGGNDIPRIVETPAGLLNSIGLANVGVERFLIEKAPEGARFGCPVVANIAGATEVEYCRVLERLESSDVPWGYEINVSCPNVKQGGLAFGTDPQQIERLTRELRARTRRPLVVKLTPNVTDITVIARAAEQGGADALSCINTCIGMVIDTQRKRPVFSMKTGGLSGPAIRPIGVAMAYKVCRAVSIPVIGMGGIMTADDAVQYLLAGATAVQIGTGNFVDPRIPVAVIEGIEQYCLREGLTSVAQVRTLMAD
ncbi:MAG: dihydroorotate dehydrogenase [Chitinispirillaceae bacterium]|nr:dihydroorotate dehydrogenase [Chitinispirillaceae bacterium]